MQRKVGVTLRFVPRASAGALARILGRGPGAAALPRESRSALKAVSSTFSTRSRFGAVLVRAEILGLLSGMLRRPVVFGAFFLLATLSSSAANWPQYRGVQASGIDASAPLPTQWNVETGENIRWQTPVPGLAHASPIVWGERVYIATAVGGKQDLKVGLYGNIDSVKNDEAYEWRLLALEKGTGKVLWNVLAHAGVPKVARHTKATHCNSTPATDGQRIVALFGSEGLFCFDTAGKMQWKKDLGPMDSGYFQVPTAQWGFASSPIIHDGKVIVVCDVQKDSFVAAFDLADGREVWRTARSDVPTWGTPTVVVASGRTQMPNAVRLQRPRPRYRVRCENRRHPL